ncbi:MAG: putative membrane protein YdjX (TVP38/TMEM64 family) [Arenicella sp.]|jgi:uncharacterized membrane protein YdjX (TVP38/TMEM64 family)
MKTKLILAAVIAALIAAFFFFDLKEYVTLDYLKSQQSALSELYANKPFLIIAIFFLVYTAMAGLSIPFATPLTLAAGAIFGTVTGTIIVSFASSIGATIAFMLTRFLFHDSIEKKFGDRLTGMNAGIEKEGAFYVFGLRLVPILPFVVLNSVLGLTKLKTITFYWASQLGMLVGTVVYVNAGTQLASINSIGDIASAGLIASFVALGVLPIISKYILNTLRQRRQA